MNSSERDRGSFPAPIDAGRWTALVAALSLAVAGCGDSGAGPDPAVPMSISTTLEQLVSPASVTPADAPGVSASVRSSSGARPAVTAVDGAGDTLKLDAAMVLIENIQVHRQGSGDCGSADACVATEVKRLLLEVPMDTTREVRSVGLVGQIDADIYDELRYELGIVQASDTTAVDSFPELEGASMLIEGSFNGEAFTFTSDLETSVAVTLSPVLDVSDSPTATNVTLSAPVTRWFMGSDNTFMDPTVSENAAAIAEAVAESFTAFPDADADGEPDRSGPVSGGPS